MSVAKSDIASRYLFNKTSDAPILITPEASILLRGLLRLTLQRAADASSIKRTHLLHFEDDNRPLSTCSKRWLQSMFESAGAEFFMGQGKLYVLLNNEEVISQGEVSDKFKNLPIGHHCREERYAREGSNGGHLSQKALARISGIPQCRISAIENHRPEKFYLADQLALRRVLDTIPRRDI